MQDKGFSSPTKTQLLNWLFHGADGPWANISGRFVDETTGVVKIMTEAPNPDGVFAKTELPKFIACLQSGAITDIAGTPRAKLLELASGGDIANDILRAAKIDTRWLLTV